jgi:putative tricarboxylic transport membrane protein
MSRIPGPKATTNLPVLRLGEWRLAVDVPHLLFASGMALWCVWYGRDAWLAAADVQNLILIAPGTIAAVVLYLVVLKSCLHVTRAAASPVISERAPLSPLVKRRIAGLMILLAAFVLAAPTLGFDVASFAYLLGTLLFLGERRPLMLILVPLLFCVVAIYCFQTILATPLPLMFFGDAA